MPKQTFINLPVRDLAVTTAFFEKLGFTFNPDFTDDKAACMIITPESFVMLLSEPFFKTFIKKELVDASKATEVLIALSTESKAEVDGMIEKVLAAGGSELREAQDHGFMYTRTFDDPSGHTWEVFWMDPSGMPVQA